MLAVEVRFLHGTLRAGSASDAGKTGLADPGEWPPSPARLFAAFVAADGTGQRCRVTDGSELELLETADPPTIHAHPRVLRSRLAERFVVENHNKKGSTTQSYPLRKNTLVRPGTRLAPFEPACVYVWDDLAATDDQREALRLRAARIGYVGAADCPAVVRLLDELPPDLPPAWTPASDGRISLPVTFDGLLAALNEAYATFTGGGQVQRGWLPSRQAAYRAPDQPEPTGPTGETVWLRLEPAVADHHVLAVTETLRDAVLAHYPADEAPTVLHGHGMTGEGWHQARYLPLVEVGHAFATGRIHGGAVWLPPDTPEEVRAGVRTAVLAIRRLVRGDRFDVAVGLHGGASRPWAANPRRWTGPARRWVSATPVVHERHGPVDDAEVGRWCEHAGLPAPVRWRLSRHPLTTGGLRLRGHALAHRYPGAPFSHVALEFARSQTGPLAIGRGRQFGLGLLAPDRRRDE